MVGDSVLRQVIAVEDAAGNATPQTLLLLLHVFSV